jgi:hypothetical protein
MSFQFQERNGYSAFALYNSLKLHFSSPSYDYFKYHGKTNISETSFMKRKDKYSFYKLSRKYNLEQLKNFYIANILETDIKWIGDIMGPEGEETFKKWQKRNESLTYRFEQDVIFLFESSGNFLHVDNGTYPYLLTCMLQNDIMIETVAILNDLMGFLPMWERKIQDDIIWPNWKLKIEKYTPFIHYDKPKLKSILKENIHESV